MEVERRYQGNKSPRRVAGPVFGQNALRQESSRMEVPQPLRASLEIGSRSKGNSAPGVGMADHLEIYKGENEESKENRGINSSARMRRKGELKNQSENKENVQPVFRGFYETPQRKNANNKGVESSEGRPEPFSEISNLRLVVSPSQREPGQAGLSMSRKSEKSYYICQDHEDLDVFRAI